jgi:hypothetical protein
MRGGPRRVVRTLPGLRRVAADLDALREERDRLRRDRDRVRAERDRLLAARVEEAAIVRPEDVPAEARRGLLAHPSFLAHLEALKRHRLALDAAGHTDQAIWWLSSKPGGRELAERVGVPVPPLLAAPMASDELAWPEDAEAGVLKPSHGSGGKAVFALRRDGERFWSLRQQRWMPWERIVARVRGIEADGGVRGPYLLEQLVPGVDPWQLPYDWKCYCIAGEPELILQKASGRPTRPGRAAFKYWLPSWEPAGPVGRWDQLDPDLPAPQEPTRLLEAARRVAGAVPGPFVRVDLLESPGRVWFGELTPHPGGPPLFTHATDRRLGEAWERALVAEAVARCDGAPVHQDAGTPDADASDA